MPRPIDEFWNSLQAHAASYGEDLSDQALEKLGCYYKLLLKWNDRLHLVAPCSPDEFATRHVLESLMLLRHLSLNARVADVGSGAGLPIIPCLIVRRDLRATLIESSPRKAVFLHEALREVDSLPQAQLIVARFEQASAPAADFVTCRALDRFQQVLPALIDWGPHAATFLLYGGLELRRKIEAILPAAKVEPIPQSERRFLIIAKT